MALPEAAAIVPVRPGGDILLMLRDDRPDLPNANRWTTIGGAVEPGESPEAAALREAEEELGVRPEKLLPMGSIDGQRFRSFLFATPVTWTLRDLIVGEGQGVAWFRPDALAEAPVVRHLSTAIARFVETEAYRAFAAGTPPDEGVPAPFSSAAAQELELLPGRLAVLIGATAAFVHCLRGALNGARLTTSPAAYERPDLVLWWARGEPCEPVLRTWRDRLADGGALLVIARPDGHRPDPNVTGLRDAARRAGWFEDGWLMLPDGERALRLVKPSAAGPDSGSRSHPDRG